MAKKKDPEHEDVSSEEQDTGGLEETPGGESKGNDDSEEKHGSSDITEKEEEEDEDEFDILEDQFEGEEEYGIEDVMKVSGRIVEVMESYPPQLIVDVDGRNYYVGLIETTRVTREGQATDFFALRPNLNIIVEGKRSELDETAMTATRIELL